MATLGHLLALLVTAAHDGDRTQLSVLCEAVEEAIGETGAIEFVDQADNDHDAADQADPHGLWRAVLR